MRFKITLQLSDPRKNTLPINYQYELSAWIYHTIETADPAFSMWLHDKGYSSGTQRFKFFTFSNILFAAKGYTIEGDRLRILVSPCELIISFLIEGAAMPFITGIFRSQVFSIGDFKSSVGFIVSSVERIPDPVFTDAMTFKTLSPIIVGKSRLAEGGKGTEYLNPAHTDYGNLFFQNLQRKVEIYKLQKSEINILPQPGTCHLQLLSQPRSKIILIKNGQREATHLRGFIYEFKISAPVEWLRVGYYAGFGEKNSLGFGCVEVIRQQ